MEKTLDAREWREIALQHLESRDYDGALAAARRAFELAPDDPKILLIYAGLVGEFGQFAEQRRLLERARALGLEDWRWNRLIGLWQLREGDYAAGWPHFVAGCVTPDAHDNKSFLQIPIPVWEGDSLASKAAVLFTDEWLGFGDTIFFFRWVRELGAKAEREDGKILWCCHAELEALFRRSLDSKAILVTTHGALSPCELPERLPYAERFSGLDLLKSSLLQLPLHLGASVSLDFPYLVTDARKVEIWRQRLSSDKCFRVGVSWTSSQSNPRNSLRVIPLAELLDALKDIAGVTLYSLQMGGPSAGMIDLTSEFKTFDDTAAFMRNLDLVIVIDGVIAHLAGALDVPTWVLVDLNPHYTWGRTGKETSFYRSVRVYRQRVFRNWNSVIEEVRKDLGMA